MFMVEISWLGVLVVTVVNFVTGGVYYGIAIAKVYARAMGRENELIQKPSILMIAGPAVCGLLMTITNAVLIKMLDIHDLSDAIIFGATVGIGYLVPMTMTISINPNFPRPFLYTSINGPYFVFTSLVGSAILVSIG